jgi:ubiquinone/menaquinone biosynthesis C-methylase UbiE
MARTSAEVARVYDRGARLYDMMQAPMEWMGGRRRRRRVLEDARGSVLEVGAGTGSNFEHYGDGVDLVAIDLSSEMLKRAGNAAAQAGRRVALVQADAEALPFADGAFDTVTATCVFCSVADPVQGLRELGRVVKRDGRILLLEHVRPENPVLGRLFDLLTPITRRLMGPEINRRTVDNVQTAGLRVANVEADGVWREIDARAP